MVKLKNVVLTLEQAYQLAEYGLAVTLKDNNLIIERA